VSFGGFGEPPPLLKIIARGTVSARRGRLPPDPAAIRAATRAVLDDQAYQDAARQVQREIEALPDIAKTADIVEQAP
jgi:UDP:flavonoid glycosyltransferase YjiC (YdhE family)